MLVPSGLGIGVAALCLPSCQVPSQVNAGFLPPVTIVQSGAAVTWSTLDSVHTASEETDFCFHVVYHPGKPVAARFVVHDDALHAANVGDDLRACSAATRLPDGSFQLPYTCFYHPNTMNGILVVK